MIEKDSLHTAWAGSQIVYLDSTASTNDVAKGLASNGAAHGTLVIANAQTAGRGRMGRRFVSAPGEGIWMSLVIKDEILPMKASMLTLVMGLAAAKAIEQVADVKPMIKWPNDIVLSGKKLVGILTEMSLSMDKIGHIIIGIGINVHQEVFPEELQTVATSIFLENGKHMQRNMLMKQVLQQFEQYYQLFMKTQDLSLLMEAYNDCLINRGRQVQVQDPKGSYLGVALGINQDGELLVETKQGICAVASGEVSVRGVLGYV